MDLIQANNDLSESYKKSLITIKKLIEKKFEKNLEEIIENPDIYAKKFEESYENIQTRKRYMGLIGAILTYSKRKDVIERKWRDYMSILKEAVLKLRHQGKLSDIQKTKLGEESPRSKKILNG
jgi:hypothetical protein